MTIREENTKVQIIVSVIGQKDIFIWIILENQNLPEYVRISNIIVTNLGNNKFITNLI